LEVLLALLERVVVHRLVVVELGRVRLVRRVLRRLSTGNVAVDHGVDRLPVPPALRASARASTTANVSNRLFYLLRSKTSCLSFGRPVVFSRARDMPTADLSFIFSSPESYLFRLVGIFTWFIVVCRYLGGGVSPIK